MIYMWIFLSLTCAYTHTCTHTRARKHAHTIKFQGQNDVCANLFQQNRSSSCSRCVCVWSTGHKDINSIWAQQRFPRWKEQQHYILKQNQKKQNISNPFFLHTRKINCNIKGWKGNQIWPEFVQGGRRREDEDDEESESVWKCWRLHVCSSADAPVLTVTEACQWRTTHAWYLVNFSGCLATSPTSAWIPIILLLRFCLFSVLLARRSEWAC